MYIIKSGDKVWRRDAHIYGRFLEDATMFKATLMTEERANLVLQENLQEVVASTQPSSPFRHLHLDTLAEWQAATLIKVELREVPNPL